MRFKLYGSKKFYENSRWSKDGDTYTRVKRHADEDILRFNAEIKNVKSSLKGDSDDPLQKEMIIYGIANANIVDRMDERLEPRGLDMQSFLRNPVLLAFHDHQRPIGKILELDIQEDGIYFVSKIGYPEKGSLTEDQIMVRSLVNQGILRTVSVGFIPKRIKAPEFSDDGEMLRELVIEEWEMLELSIVSVPANQGSLFDVKNCESLKNSGIVNPETKKSINQRQGNPMLKKLKALQALLLKSKNLVDLELDEKTGEAKLTFVVEGVKSEDDLVEALKSPEIKAEGDAEDSKEGMQEALTMLRGIASDLKENNSWTKDILTKMDKPAGEEEVQPKEEEDPEKTQEPVKPEDKPSDENEKDFEARFKAIEDSQKEFQDNIRQDINRIGDILAILVPTE